MVDGTDENKAALVERLVADEMKSIELAFVSDELSDEPERLTIYLTSLAYACFAEGHRAGMAHAAEKFDELFADLEKHSSDYLVAANTCAEGRKFDLAARFEAQAQEVALMALSVKRRAAAMRAALPTQETP